MAVDHTSQIGLLMPVVGSLGPSRTGIVFAIRDDVLRERHVRLEKTNCELCLRELRPHRCVIGWILALAHFAIHPGGGAAFGQRLACQDRVDA
jgi:hypothetical protein